MKLKFSGNELYKCFNLISGIVPSSSVKHILQGVRVDIRNGMVELMATDLEMLVKYNLSAGECVEEGNIVLPAIRVNNILREWAGNDEVVVGIEGSSCTLRSRGGHFKIMGEISNSFPEVRVSDVKGFVEIDGDVVSNSIGKVVHAVSSVKVRSPLSGVLVKVEGSDVVVVAADGNRLSYIKRKVENSDGVSVDGVITVKCLTFLQKFIAECGGVLRIGIGESQVRFLGEKGEVISQLMEGEYPKYEDVIPKGNDKKIEVSRDELMSMVRMASFMTSEGYRVVKFVFKSGKLVLISKAADVGEAELEMNIDYSGDEFEINFNPDYVLDALRFSENEKIIMEVKDNDTAALFRTGHEQIEVVMPVELK